VTHSDQINELAAALAKAQGEIENATKDSANPFFKSKFASLASVRAVITDPLSKHGIAYTQTISNTETQVTVTTMLMHSSGQWLRDSLSLTPKDDGPQAFGSASSYGRRYALAAIAGVAAEDDDAESAEARSKPTPVKAVAPPGFDNWLHDLAAVADTGIEELQKVWKSSKADYRNFLTQHHGDDWMKLKQTAAKVPKAETVA
jgi:hypothetical protein